MKRKEAWKSDCAFRWMNKWISHGGEQGLISQISRVRVPYASQILLLRRNSPSCDQSVTSSLQSDFLMFYLHHRKIPSGHLFLAMQFVSEFIWVNVRWNGPTWQAKTIISYFTVNSQLRKRPTSDVIKHVIGIQPVRTNQRLKIADLRHRLKIKQTKQTDCILRFGPLP